MAFDTSNDWTPFQGVESGENETVEGLMPLDEDASAFRYRKTIRVDVLGVDPSNFSQPISGNWKVRVRADASRNSDGSYAGLILFEQDVVWVADVIAFDFGGLLSVTWAPRGSSGSGTQHTSICDASECAVVANPGAATPEEFAAYGETGAWRFLNEVPVSAGAAPNQKFDAERGFVAPETFDPEGSLGIGSVSFYCEWQSAGYTFDIPEGAILETVFDRWQVGRLDDEALFRVSVKTGGGGEQLVCDAFSGQTWGFRKDKGALVCERTRRGTFGGEPKVTVAPKTGAFRVHHHGHALTAVFQVGSDTFVRTSRDDGRTWTGENKVVSGLKMLDSVGDEESAELIIFGIATAASSGIANGDLVRAVLTRTPTGWQLKERNKVAPARESVPLPSKPKGRFARQNTSIVWMVTDNNGAQLWKSRDNGLSFDLAS